MKFTEHRDSNIFTVKHYDPQCVKINNLQFHNSFFITQFSTEKNWPCKHIQDLTLEHLNQLLEKKPEVIILGTGNKQVFPSPRFFAHCAMQGIGLEVMANDAACRTYNVLTTEDREVLLALILEPEDE